MTKRSISYRPEIDGLRALAVLPVLFFHADLGFSGGFVGVDVFFVISGFLIGSWVISEIEAGTFRLINFWERRVRRLFPALAAVVIACLAVGVILLVPEHLGDLAKSVIAQPLLGSNFYFWRQTGYFEAASEFQPLLHTWTLAVEEQFYLFFPPIFLLLMRWGRRVALGGILVFIAASLAWSIYGTVHYPSFAFFLIPSRIWELDLGVLLALLSNRKHFSPLVNEVISWIGLLLIFWAVFFFDINTEFPGWAALLPCLGAAFVIYGNSAGLTSVGRMLKQRPLVFIGKISYSLYLIHWPAIVFLKYFVIRDLPSYWLAGSLGFSFLLACLSWKYVETPFREKRFFPSRKRLFVFSGALSALFIITGAVFYWTDGIPSRFPSEVTKHKKEREQIAGFSGLGNFIKTGEMFTVGKPVEPNSPPQLMLWGDSHGMTIMPLVDAMGKKHGIGVYAAAEPGIAPLAGIHRADFYRFRGDIGTPALQFALDKQIKHVLLVGRWGAYINGLPNGDMGLILCDAETESKNPDQAKNVFVKNLRKTVSRLRKNGISVWIMRDVAFQPRDVPVTLAQAASRGMDLNSFALPTSVHRKNDEKINQLIDEAVEGLGAILLDPFPSFTDPSGIYLMAKDGRALYNDRDHLTKFGGMQLEGLLKPIFETITLDSSKKQR